MAQLIVRKLEDKVVRKLKERAARSGVSTEEEVRRILRHSVDSRQKRKPKAKSKMTFWEYLLTMPDVGRDSDFNIPRKGKMREIDLSD